jgi:hypothetical protein
MQSQGRRAPIFRRAERGGDGGSAEDLPSKRQARLEDGQAWLMAEIAR